MTKKNICILVLVLTVFLSLLLLLIYNHKNIKFKEFLKRDKIELFFDRLSMKPHKFSVWMSINERRLLIDKLNNAKHYLEFGSGGSTYLSLLNSDADVVSVESDNDWLNYMRKWRLLRHNEGKRLVLYYVNIGKIAYSGFPADMKNEHLFFKYSKNVFKDYPRDYDLVLIDGRFRVACALQTILNTKENTVILWHDFPIRPYYHEALKFLDIAEKADNMVVLKKKKNINRKDVEAMYEKYKNDAR